MCFMLILKSIENERVLCNFAESLHWRRVLYCTCATNVQSQIVMKTTFRLRPSNTFRCPWIFRALTSLNRVIMTNVLKMIVKCCVGCVCSPVSRPLSMSSSSSPAARKLSYLKKTLVSLVLKRSIDTLALSVCVCQFLTSAYTDAMFYPAFVCLSVRLFVCLSICLFVYLFVCLSVSNFV